MSPKLLVDPETEEQLQGFLQQLAQDDAIPVRTLAHAWNHPGGELAVGKHAIRLTCGDPALTAGTLFADAASAGPVLELSRVQLLHKGLTPTQWDDWCDEQDELREFGFDPNVKYPRVKLRGLPEGPLLRLAVGLRDLWFALH